MNWGLWWPRQPQAKHLMGVLMVMGPRLRCSILSIARPQLSWRHE